MNKNNYKQKLTHLVFNSNLDGNQKLLWQLFLKLADPEEDEAVYEAASESEKNLLLLSRYLQEKIWDMKEKNKEAWDKIIDSEEEYADILK